MANHIALSYRRSSGELSTGHVFLYAEEDFIEKVTTLDAFEDLPYEDMMRRLAVQLREHPDVAKAYVQRTDRPGLLGQELAANFVQLLREDPLEAIRSCTFHVTAPTVRKLERPRTTVVQTLSTAPLIAGVDAFVESLGPIIYARLRADEMVECPGCGFWVPYRDDSGPEESPNPCTYCNKKCGQSLSVWSLQGKRGSNRWVGFHIERSLLITDLPRFYFPRAWNEYRAWVTREQLQHVFLEWKKEMESTAK
jgi:hypothetical protein